VTLPPLPTYAPRRARARALLLAGCLALTACAGRNAVWVEPGSTAARVVFRVANTPGGAAPIDFFYGLTVATCEGGRVMWTMRNADTQSAARPIRIVYGEPPAGYVSATGPLPLVPGCYRATVSGPASTEFVVRADGSVAPVAADAR